MDNERKKRGLSTGTGRKWRDSRCEEKSVHGENTGYSYRRSGKDEDGLLEKEEKLVLEEMK